MVSFVRLHNLLKESACRQLLTQSQEHAFFDVYNAMGFANRLNLYGDCGVGKTYLAWALAKELGASYLPSEGSRVERAPLVIIDDAPVERNKSRLLYDEALNFAPCVLLVTRERIDDHVFSVELSISVEDLTRVGERLRTLGGPLNEPDDFQQGLLWNYFRVRA